jgi:hypothetical protein
VSPLTAAARRFRAATEELTAVARALHAEDPGHVFG